MIRFKTSLSTYLLSKYELALLYPKPRIIIGSQTNFYGLPDWRLGEVLTSPYRKTWHKYEHKDVDLTWTNPFVSLTQLK
jgi:hypothetical protein